MSAAPHKAHDFQGVPVRQDGLSVEPLGDDLPVPLYRNPLGIKARIGQIVGQGAPGQLQPFSVDLYQLVSSFRNKKSRTKELHPWWCTPSCGFYRHSFPYYSKD